jgi:diacylglycerol kinase family enzyme
MTAAATTGPVTPVLLINPRSGGGKAQRYDLVARCRARGIEPVVMKEGDDLASLAAGAVSSGADVIGMAGGDGSQAVVATVASRHDIPYVCIPAGTRNHFALDIGVDRDDVIGALDAFHHASERRIDLGRVNGRTFVNNASIGLYGKIVQSPEYRDAKLRTVIEMLPNLLGPGAAPFDLRFSDPGGATYEAAQLVLVSNNRYQLDPLGHQGTRGTMDGGTLGVVVVPDGPPLRPLREWTTLRFEIDSGAIIDVGLDGEAIRLEPPLRFESLPAALRIRTPGRQRHPGPRHRSL